MTEREITCALVPDDRKKCRRQIGFNPSVSTRCRYLVCGEISEQAQWVSSQMEPLTPTPCGGEGFKRTKMSVKRAQANRVASSDLIWHCLALSGNLNCFHFSHQSRKFFLTKASANTNDQTKTLTHTCTLTRRAVRHGSLASFVQTKG